MRKKLFTLSATAVAVVMTAGALTACTPEVEKPKLTDSPLTGVTLADFSEGSAETFFESDGWTNESVFNTWWKKSNVTYTDGAMHLGITENPDGSVETYDEYYGGEARSHQYFGYGDFKVKMKPAKAKGTASTFFTCTGPYDENEDGEPNPHDEIDIEFLGTDTTHVQFNYFVNGVGGHEYMHDLGFDASAEYHEYGYRWTKDYIVWFVDDEPVYKVTASEDNPLPSTPGRILMNHWCGTPEAEGWMGEYELDTTVTCDYKSVSTSATPIGTLPEKVEVEEFEGDWGAIEAIDPGFTSSDGTHTITVDGTSSHVVYEEVDGGSYNNITGNINEAATDKNWVHAVLENNGEKAVTFRLNVVSGGENIHALNSYAFVNGEVVTNTPFEGTIVTVEPGESAEMEIAYKGVANTLEFMLDSIRGSGTWAGDVTISEIKFAKQGEIVLPEEPSGENNGVTIDETNVKFSGSIPSYIINTDEESNSMKVTYADVAGGSYANISAAAAQLAQGKTTFTVKVKNNAAAPVKVRVDITGESGTATNLSATATNDVAINTDTVYGGSMFTLAEEGETLVTITYTSNGKNGKASKIMFFLDTWQWDDKETHAGDVTFSEMAFGGEEEVKEPEPPKEPEGDNVNLTFASATYTVDNAEDGVNVTYTDFKGNSYSTSTAEAATHAAGKNTFSLKIKNNGTEAVQARVDVLATEQIGNTAACNVSATAIGGTEVRTDTEWGGSFVTVAAGEEVTLIITFDGESDRGAVTVINVFLDSARGTEDLFSGNVTLSEFKFSSVTAE